MKVVQGGAAGWSEFRVMVWAMTVSMDSVMRSRVFKRMMLDVSVTIEEKLEERVRQQRAREQQFEWEYCCWLRQQGEQEQEQHKQREQEQEQHRQKEQEQEWCRQAKGRERQYREAQAWWVLASEETSSNEDFTACRLDLQLFRLVHSQ
jgi:hypothetical protein